MEDYIQEIRKIAGQLSELETKFEKEIVIGAGHVQGLSRKIKTRRITGAVTGTGTTMRKTVRNPCLDTHYNLLKGY